MKARTAFSVMVILACVGLSMSLWAQEKNKSASVQAFMKVAEVLKHPRCLNCHPSGNRPLQGDDSHTHFMHVVRGPEGFGKNGLWCSTCHQEENLPEPHLPPGAPGWQLPPGDMPMVFEGATPGQLCEHLKNPSKNGMRSPQDMVEHVSNAPIVLWGWSPGPGRTPVPISHDEFVKAVKDWIDNGAVCPEEVD